MHRTDDVSVKLRLFWALAMAVLCGLALRAAWLSDDAFITLRVVDNFLHGYGLRWNIDERVQVYTHPLWMMLLVPIYGITREPFYTVGFFGIALSMTAVYLMSRALRPGRAVLLVLLLCPSRSVLAFFSSGLENPLALILLTAIVLYADRMDDSQRDATRAVLLVSLLALTRVDLVLLGGPIVLFKLRRATIVRAVLLGGMPFVAWELFSVVYYGSLVPNTAYAKLQTGIPHQVILRQGVKYFRSLGWWDAWGALLLAAGTGVALVTRRTLALGLALYGVYVWWIGGDFMAGRFFSTPIVLAAFCLCEARWGRVVYVAAIFTLPLLFVDRLAREQPPFEAWLRGEGGHWERWGVADERQFWAPSTGLFTAARPRDIKKNPLYQFARRTDNKAMIIESCIGMVGFYARRDLHIIDPLGLSDPLIARLPVVNPGLFRIGHFERTVPPGYPDTALQGVPLVVDPDLKAYDALLLTITRGPLFTTDRARAIATISSGRAEPLRLAYVQRYRASQGR